LILADGKGAYVGALQRQIVPCRADVANVHRQLGEARKEEAARLAPVVARALPVAQANRDMHRNNLAVVNGQPVTSEEIESARELRASIRKGGKQALNDLLDGAAEAVGTAAPRGPSGNIESSVTLAPSAQKPAEQSDSEANSLIDDVL
jgi:hypothetical protein